MRLCCIAQLVAALCVAGCGTVQLFGTYDLPESPEVADAPWPRLVDTPDAPELGQFSAAVPDPETGETLVMELSDRAVVAAIQAEGLSGPVLTEADRRAMARALARRR